MLKDISVEIKGKQTLTEFKQETAHKQCVNLLTHVHMCLCVCCHYTDE